ncbi:hypothetical protein HN014_01340 [Aquimarina sp. TRL1]|uniref:hypothetical protein n=1 Tax=Aquimarina sp. (strain TRL1) TaxID=2736252 RepID=UPI00158950AB|nr:hypothetical protein [Aquimarina sp. TRL1]QKX03612.1 hypothetical protein HN014_01340 [Aquimarina sp. TRL1]
MKTNFLLKVVCVQMLFLSCTRSLKDQHLPHKKNVRISTRDNTSSFVGNTKKTIPVDNMMKPEEKLIVLFSASKETKQKEAKWMDLVLSPIGCNRLVK